MQIYENTKRINNSKRRKNEQIEKKLVVYIYRVKEFKKIRNVKKWKGWDKEKNNESRLTKIRT